MISFAASASVTEGQGTSFTVAAAAPLDCQGSTPVPTVAVQPVGLPHPDPSFSGYRVAKYSS